MTKRRIKPPQICNLDVENLSYVTYHHHRRRRRRCHRKIVTGLVVC
jgi:hypothetical protein